MIACNLMRSVGKEFSLADLFRMTSNYVGKSIPGFPQRADDFPDSLQGVEAACVESRMAADTMNSEERAAFPQYNSPNKKKEYLYIRKRFKQEEFYLRRWESR